LQCSSVIVPAFSQYSPQYLLPGRALHSQPWCAHFLGLVGSAMAGLLRDDEVCRDAGPGASGVPRFVPRVVSTRVALEAASQLCRRFDARTVTWRGEEVPAALGAAGRGAGGARDPGDVRVLRPEFT
jgi:hypothetical protein